MSLHYRILRIACKDYGSILSRDELSERCQKATPDEWSNYTTASVSMKIYLQRQPTRKTTYAISSCKHSTLSEGKRPRGCSLMDQSQRLENRLQHVKNATEPWSEAGSKLTNDKLRVILKKTFFKHTAIKGPCTPRGGPHCSPNRRS